MRDFWTAILRFFLGAGSGITALVLIGLAYYLAKN